MLIKYCNFNIEKVIIFRLQRNTETFIHIKEKKKIRLATMKAVQISLTKSQYKILCTVHSELFLNARKLCDVEI